ncbi:MAG: cadherin-like beta sandwich domain-containing protein, partial [Bacillota bacterium]|nr:cadherin-like beta sandwich domain-containing protein [Bacillota bacterium]
MKKTNRLLSILLVFGMIAGLLPVSVFADGETGTTINPIPEIIVTKVVINGANYTASDGTSIAQDAYDVLEIYNASGKTLDLRQYGVAFKKDTPTDLLTGNSTFSSFVGTTTGTQINRFTAGSSYWTGYTEDTSKPIPFAPGESRLVWVRYIQSGYLAGGTYNKYLDEYLNLGLEKVAKAYKYDPSKVVVAEYPEQNGQIVAPPTTNTAGTNFYLDMKTTERSWFYIVKQDSSGNITASQNTNEVLSAGTVVSTNSCMRPNTSDNGASCSLAYDANTGVSHVSYTDATTNRYNVAISLNDYFGALNYNEYPVYISETNAPTITNKTSEPLSDSTISADFADDQSIKYIEVDYKNPSDTAYTVYKKDFVEDGDVFYDATGATGSVKNYSLNLKLSADFIKSPTIQYTIKVIDTANNTTILDNSGSPLTATAITTDDTAAAATLDTAIDGLGATPTIDAVKAVRSQFELLTPIQKTLVTKYSALVALESSLYTYGLRITEIAPDPNSPLKKASADGADHTEFIEATVIGSDPIPLSDLKIDMVMGTSYTAYTDSVFLTEDGAPKVLMPGKTYLFGVYQTDSYSSGYKYKSYTERQAYWQSFTDIYGISAEPGCRIIVPAKSDIDNSTYDTTCTNLWNSGDKNVITFTKISTSTAVATAGYSTTAVGYGGNGTSLVYVYYPGCATNPVESLLYNQAGGMTPGTIYPFQISADQDSFNAAVAPYNAAVVVDAQIAALNSASATYKDDVKAARAAYDALTADQKAYVSKYALLRAAEKAVYDYKLAVTEILFNAEYLAKGTATLGNEHSEYVEVTVKGTDPVLLDDLTMNLIMGADDKQLTNPSASFVTQSTVSRWLQPGQTYVFSNYNGDSYKCGYKYSSDADLETIRTDFNTFYSSNVAKENFIVVVMNTETDGSSIDLRGGLYNSGTDDIVEFLSTLHDNKTIAHAEYDPEGLYPDAQSNSAISYGYFDNQVNDMIVDTSAYPTPGTIKAVQNNPNATTIDAYIDSIVNEIPSPKMLGILKSLIDTLTPEQQATLTNLNEYNTWINKYKSLGAATNNSVVVTGISSNPAGTNNQFGYVEVLNNGNTAVDLRNYKLAYTKSTINYVMFNEIQKYASGDAMAEPGTDDTNHDNPAFLEPGEVGVIWIKNDTSTTIKNYTTAQFLTEYGAKAKIFVVKPMAVGTSAGQTPAAAGTNFYIDNYSATTGGFVYLIDKAADNTTLSIKPRSDESTSFDTLYLKNYPNGFISGVAAYGPDLGGGLTSTAGHLDGTYANFRYDANNDASLFVDAEYLITGSTIAASGINAVTVASSTESHKQSNLGILKYTYIPYDLGDVTAPKADDFKATGNNTTISFTGTVTDDTDVRYVEFGYKLPGDTAYTKTTLDLVQQQCLAEKNDSAKTSISVANTTSYPFSKDVTGTFTDGTVVSYYLKAIDGNNNTLSSGTEEAPLTLTVSTSGTSQAVTDTINLINAIGSTPTETTVDAALSAYTALSPTDQALVTNYSTLTAAMDTLAVSIAKAAVTIPSTTITGDFKVSTSYSTKYGLVFLSWNSTNAAIVFENDSGNAYVTRPAYGQQDAAFTVAVGFAKGAANDSNSFNVTVPAETATLSTDATLSNITLDGTPVEGFSSTKYTYDVVLPYAATQAPLVAFTTTDKNANAVTSQDQTIPSSVVINVTAQDGATKLAYTVNFTRGLPSTNANLSNIEPSMGTLDKTFDTNTTDYTVVLPTGTTTVPNITVTPEDTTATVVPISDSPIVPATITITVTAQDGTTTKQYFVHYVIGKSKDATLKDLQVNGTTVSGFSSSVDTYNVTLPYGTSVIPSVTATTNSTLANAVVTPADKIDG